MKEIASIAYDRGNALAKRIEFLSLVRGDSLKRNDEERGRQRKGTTTSEV